ncbi:hypothetical protein NSQ20_10020 [Paenibacillus sp. FSL K6-1122]
MNDKIIVTTRKTAVTGGVALAGNAAITPITYIWYRVLEIVQIAHT